MWRNKIKLQVAKKQKKKETVNAVMSRSYIHTHAYMCIHIVVFIWMDIRTRSNHR